MEVSTEKSKIMTNSANNIFGDIFRNSKKLEEVTSFQCLGENRCKSGTCSIEIRFRIAPAMATITRLNRIWRGNTMNSKAYEKERKKKKTTKKEPTVTYNDQTRERESE